MVDSDKDNNRAVARPWFAVTSIGLSTFSVVTTEMLPVGLLNPMADTLGTSVGTAGLMITLPALFAALFAPLVILVSGGIDRRRILCLLMLLLIVANIVSAMSTNLSVLLAARIAVGFCMGGIWAIAGGLAPRLVKPSSIGFATSIIFGGVAAASVFGVPIGAFIGDTFGWRIAFFCMAIFAFIVLLLLYYSLPSLPVSVSITLKQYTEIIVDKKVIVGLLITLFLVSGHFMAYTFIRPLLQFVSEFQSYWIGPALFMYGILGIIGNFISGIISVRNTILTVILISIGLTTSIILFPILGSSYIGSSIVILLWGLSYGGVSVSLMTWMMKSSPKAIEISTSLYISVFNIAIAFGSFLGGYLVDKYGLLNNTFIAGAFVFIAFIFVVLNRIKHSE
ncbi:MFS transporter [Xenorhabdus hominickii]|uniref:MFS transporter n=1 Tax=Xenorhabdus hominickii TaxID=351679 RepID=A0A2G0Q0C5_XENHO|nr:MFS transporter [Xenorhabdus hominickii]AOM42697.1 MFS transporter [Xenorhabdus hominickii]PHM52652.1 hypothetical protein Xhom_04320 [Xenorhabdus hominickii]